MTASVNAGLPTLVEAGESDAIVGPVFDSTRVNIAVTATETLPAIVHEAVPVHPPPLQPLNAEPTAGVATSVTGVPRGYELEQTVPQLIPGDVLLTIPAPSPDLLTVTLRLSPSAVPHASPEKGDLEPEACADAR